MKISRITLNKAVEAGIISAKQADDLVDFVKHQPEQTPSFNMTNVLYYLGGLLAIGAMSLFMNLGWEMFGGWGIVYLSLLYAVLGLLLAHQFAKKSLFIPAGICATFVIAITPLAIYGLQLAIGWWPNDSPYREYHNTVEWNWILMELGTLLVAVVLAWIYRYPFMLMPIAVTLWYMSMDISLLFAGQDASFQLSAQISMYFGLIMILLAFWVDLRSRASLDYAFWLYLFGVITFWGGLTCQYSDSEWAKFFYCCVNLLMIIIGVILVRKVFVIFGAIGFGVYLGYLASQVFKNSILFPVALAFIGFLIIYLGTLWQKHEAFLTEKAQSILPRQLRELLQARND
ncbi:hypothetical protein [Legionella jordanis]|uniref:Membrane protein n=1 Tax=Legionella jordanis TaxID=456 RepID=A0A0W0VA82_9GAMM|nr:hypothetical protein [Legionella jordanis]KTD17038.1 membrane protein [Legionella jordanis]RMX03392.1 DUF2157 domain-containing protein [Legionella jordanis]RMX18781.1 DUF2157 domain-containing protein [Legionella jordanis]VEH12766.1 membrane protein [Legionella jordanis]HAT8713089.1 DUF2157 domain-containing protein [Legionella jordanis]